MNKRRLNVLTWPIHSSYFYYLSQANCDFYVPVDDGDRFGYGGKGNGIAFPFGRNVHEVRVADIPKLDLDIILFQARPHYEVDQYEIFSKEQLENVAKVYIEHDPPREVPTDTRHIVNDPSVTLVHVTHFNHLMWDSNGVPTTVIDHGVLMPPTQYKGHLDRGIVVINNLKSRGRRLGADIFEAVRRHVPIDLIGINATEMEGGLGEIPHHELGEFIAQYRFFFNPIRYTSLGLSIIEAMMSGMPIVGLQTTELVSVITSGVNGYVSLDVDELILNMKRLIDDPDHARELGENARKLAMERFSITRFARDWESLFHRVTSTPSLALPRRQGRESASKEDGFNRSGLTGTKGIA